MSLLDNPVGETALPGPDDDPGPSGKSATRSLVELGLVIAAVVALAVATDKVALLVVVVCLIVMIMLHELGHFLAAKHGHMKVTEYFLGFGPRLWSFRRGETEYGVKALPLGGYVKIPGMTNLEEVVTEDEDRTYRQQPFHARLLVAVAGSAMHFLMAFVLLWVLLSFVGVPSNDKVGVGQLVAIGGRPGPAQVAGLRPGDIFVSADGTAVTGDPGPLISAIHRHAGVPVTVVVSRHGVQHTLVVTPVDGRTVHEPGATAPAGTAPFGVIGVSFATPTVKAGPVTGLGRTATGLAHYSWAAVVGVAHIFTPQSTVQRFENVTSAKAASQSAANHTRVSSVVGAVQAATDAAHAGMAYFLSILVGINLFLGIFNLFPMLPFDGGHVAIAVYEKIRTGRRKVQYHADVTKLLPFAWGMVAILGVLFATTLLTDILHPMANPFG
ncbi:MAG TPA: site-2 protease family protein [Acidimicrobiales bacterium]